MIDTNSTYEKLSIPEPILSALTDPQVLKNPDVRSQIARGIAGEVDREAINARPARDIMEIYRRACEKGKKDPYHFSIIGTNTYPPKHRSFIAEALRLGWVNLDAQKPEDFLNI